MCTKSIKYNFGPNKTLIIALQCLIYTKISTIFEKLLSWNTFNFLCVNIPDDQNHSQYCKNISNMCFYPAPFEGWEPCISNRRGILEDREQCFSIQVVMNKCFLLNHEKKNLAQIRLVVFEINAPLIPKNDVTELLRFSRKWQDGSVPNFFQGVGENTC